MAPFAIDLMPGRSLFGAGCLAQLGAELSALGCSKPLLIGSPTQRSADQLKRVAGAIGSKHTCTTWSGAKAYIYPDVVDGALREVESCGADVLVTVGGGGPIGYGKMLARATGLPLACVVTTYSASETTTGQSMIEAGVKRYYDTPAVRLRVYDPELSTSLPLRLSVTSGFNAIAHAVAALYNPSSNRWTRRLAESAVEIMVGALEAIRKDPLDVEARNDALYGAWMCGSCTGTKGIQHKTAHIIGGSYGTPHADTHTVILPHSIAYCEAAAPDTTRVLCAALGAPGGIGSAAAIVYDLLVRFEAPISLQELGMKPEDLEAAAHAVMEGARTHGAIPCDYDYSRVLAMLHNMQIGTRPHSEPEQQM